MPDFTTLIQQYGLTITLLFFFLYRDLWPWIRDKLVPSYISDKQEEKQQEHADRLRREDKLIALHEQNAQAFLKLAITLENINATLSKMTSKLESMDTDISNIYGILGERRGLVTNEK